MNTPIIKTRFAPSPTGELHLGNVRTALFNVLLAGQAGGRFLLRIEDTDQSRSKPEYVEALQRDLRWLGLEWQEGPGVGGDADSYFQSERSAIYEHYFEQLTASGEAYPCYCSEQELAVARKVQMASGKPPRYPGTCAHLTEEQRASRAAEGREPTLRFRVPDGEVVEFDDLVRGKQQYRTDDIGDFIIRRHDGTAAFFFCNAIDDALMGVTHVLRGEDHLTNTPRQIKLLRALGLRVPAYGHISLIVAENGAPLSKRHGSKSLRELREMGYLPTALMNHLSRLGHTYENDPGFMSNAQLAAEFRETRLGKAPARHDPQQLLHWQKEAIVHADDESLWLWLTGRTFADGGSIESLVPEDKRIAFVQAIRDNIEMPVDAYIWAGNLFAETEQYDPDARQVIREAGKDFFASAAAVSADQHDSFKTYSKAVGQTAGVKGKQLFMPLRAALTGELRDPEQGGVWRNGPELGRLWPLLGNDHIERRIRQALALCEE